MKKKEMNLLAFHGASLAQSAKAWQIAFAESHEA